MKKKPIIIAIIILAVAAVLIISSNRNNSGETDPNGANPTGTPSAGRTRTPRDPHGTSQGQSTEKWEKQIDELLGDDSASHDTTGRGLLSIVLNKEAPISVRTDALEHALNLVDDVHFSLIQSVMGTGKNELPAPLVQIILDDTLNRPEPIQLTTSLKVLEGSHTSVIEEATDLLEFHLEEEHGTDIQKWTKAVDVYIAAEKNE